MKYIFVIAYNLFSLNGFTQNKNIKFVDLGFGIQFNYKSNLHSSHNSLVQFPNPKLFLGFGVERKTSKRITNYLIINAHQSKTETLFNYINEKENFNFSHRTMHEDVNFGFEFGIQYPLKLAKDRVSIGSGLNVQLLIPQVVQQEYSFTSNGSNGDIEYFFDCNDIPNRYGSLVYKFFIKQNLGKKMKYEIIYELNTTLNKPIRGSAIFYFNNNLIDNSSYKVDMMFMVLKMRKKF